MIDTLLNSPDLIVGLLGALATIAAAIITVKWSKNKEPTIHEPPTFDWKSNRRYEDNTKVDHLADLDALEAEIEYRKHPETVITRIKGKNEP